jgi:7-cyano-7-deazaguanine synthase in queuosine biosynthesis
MKTLIGISCGVDSTYMLWKLLTSTEDEITAVFFRYIHGAPKMRSMTPTQDGSFSETRAFEIINWLQSNTREFNFVVEELDNSFYDPNGINNPLTYLVRYAADKINNSVYDRIVFSNEKENDGYANGGTITHRRPGSMAAFDLFKSIATRGSISFPLIDSNYNQAHAIKEMPQELFALTKSCEKAFEAPCEKCFKCIKRKFFCDQVEAGKSLEEIDAYVSSKSNLPDGRWMSMKFWVLGQEPTGATTWEIPEWPSSYEVPSSG